MIYEYLLVLVRVLLAGISLTVTTHGRDSHLNCCTNVIHTRFMHIILTFVSNIYYVFFFLGDIKHLLYFSINFCYSLTLPKPKFSLFAKRLAKPGGIGGGALCSAPQKPPLREADAFGMSLLLLLLLLRFFVVEALCASFCAALQVKY